MKIPGGTGSFSLVVKCFRAMDYQNGWTMTFSATLIPPNTCHFTGRVGPGSLFSAWEASAGFQANGQSVCRWMAINCFLLRPECDGEGKDDGSNEKDWGFLKNSLELC